MLGELPDQPAVTNQYHFLTRWRFQATAQELFAIKRSSGVPALVAFRLPHGP